MGVRKWSGLMIGSVNIVVFAAVVVMVLAIVYAFSSGSLHINDRLGRLWRIPGHDRRGFANSKKKVIDSVLTGIDAIIPSVGGKAAPPDTRLVQAGLRRPEAAAALNATKIITFASLLALFYVTGLLQGNVVLLGTVAVAGGYLLPDIWLSRRVKSRQQLLRLGLPDALDLLVICMEAGLGLDQAMLYISQELRIAHPQLCDEFDLVNAEVHVGKTRMEALRSLATRTGVDDIQALVATLIQTDRFGTSIAHSLRIHSDDLRTKRRQRAEELAAKTTVKMVFPLVFFIFPALFVVILGPAVITMMRTLGQLHR